MQLGKFSFVFSLQPLILFTTTYFFGRIFTSTHVKNKENIEDESVLILPDYNSDVVLQFVRKCYLLNSTPWKSNYDKEDRISPDVQRLFQDLGINKTWKPIVRRDLFTTTDLSKRATRLTESPRKRDQETHKTNLDIDNGEETVIGQETIRGLNWVDDLESLESDHFEADQIDLDHFDEDQIDMDQIDIKNNIVDTSDNGEDPNPTDESIKCFSVYNCSICGHELKISGVDFIKSCKYAHLKTKSDTMTEFVKNNC